MDDVRRAEPDISLDLPDFPRRSETTGMSFVEFASRGEEAQRLGGYLESMGFSKIGKHKNKAADLYQQGDIRIVLNQETSGHAATQWNARGTTVCDIGIEVASAGDTLERLHTLVIHHLLSRQKRMSWIFQLFEDYLDL